MDYNEILDHIFTALPMYHKVGSSAYKEGLENIEALAAIVGNPERRLRAIHVAGTNGKGSTSHLLASYFQEKGLKVGLYTSPHLTDFRERIRINGEMIPKQRVVDFFEKFNEDFKALAPSFFEMTTALAFHHFAQEQVDIAIIEVGLGGRLDATNIISPILSIITNISLEHTQLLGDTLAKIAFEKGGIIKDGTPVVVGQRLPETWPVFEARANALHAPLFSTEDVAITEAIPSPSLHYRLISIQAGDKVIGENIRLPLQGDYQFENVATFVKAVQTIEGGNASNALIIRAIENVLTNTHLMGRWQILSERPLAICDTGHNSGGFRFVAKQLQQIECQRLHIIIGFVSDKDIDSIISLLPADAEYTVCKASVERAMSPQVICERMQRCGLNARVSEKAVRPTYEELLTRIPENDAIYVGGSTFVVADLLSEELGL